MWLATLRRHKWSLRRGGGGAARERRAAQRGAAGGRRRASVAGNVRVTNRLARRRGLAGIVHRDGGKHRRRPGALGGSGRGRHRLWGRGFPFGLRPEASTRSVAERASQPTDFTGGGRCGFQSTATGTAPWRRSWPRGADGEDLHQLDVPWVRAGRVSPQPAGARNDLGSGYGERTSSRPSTGRFNYLAERNIRVINSSLARRCCSRIATISRCARRWSGAGRHPRRAARATSVSGRRVLGGTASPGTCRMRFQLSGRWTRRHGGAGGRPRRSVRAG